MNNYDQHISSKTRILNLLRLIFTIPFFENILIRKTQGKSADSFFGKLIPPNYLYPENSLKLATRNGIKYKLDLSEYVDHFIYFGLKEDSRNKLFSFIKEGMTIIDVGTNIGNSALHFSKTTGNNGKVLGFEPDIINYNKALENIRLNPMKNITLNNFGLGDSEETLKLHNVNPGNRGMNRISDSHQGSIYSEVIIKTLDGFLKKNEINKCSLIKIDVEGFELNVLKGAIKTLKDFQPILFIELDDENLQSQGTSASGLIAFLHNHNYIVYHSENDQLLTPRSNFSNCHYDIYALPDNAQHSIN
jgi:FkbM family methyltransferase